MMSSIPLYFDWNPTSHYGGIQKQSIFTSRWRDNWQSASVVNSSLVEDPTIRLPGFDFHRRQWSVQNRFRTGQGHCNACSKKWGFTDNEQCDCGESQSMSHIVNSCPLTKFDGGLLSLHDEDEAADNIGLLAYNNWLLWIFRRKFSRVVCVQCICCFQWHLRNAIVLFK